MFQAKGTACADLKQGSKWDVETVGRGEAKAAALLWVTPSLGLGSLVEFGLCSAGAVRGFKEESRVLRLSVSRVYCVAGLLDRVGWVWKVIGLEPDNKNRSKTSMKSATCQGQL